MVRLVTCLLLCNLLAILCYAQKPVITPKQNAILQLDPQGKHIITRSDLIDNVTAVTDSPIVVQFKPPVLECSTLGSQTVKARALTNGVAGNGSFLTVGFNRNLLGVAYDPAGNLFVVENGSFSIRKIAPDGKVTVFAGTGVRGDGDGPAKTAQFGETYGICSDSKGNLYVTDAKTSRIRKIAPDGTVSTFAGDGFAALRNGVGDKASFNQPWGIACDAADNVFVADRYNYAIRKITPAGVVSTYVKTTGQPHNIAVDKDDIVYFSELYETTDDMRGHCIKRIDMDGKISIYAGEESRTLNLADGDKAKSSFGNVRGIVCDQQGNIFVSDDFAVKVITAAGQAVTIAGSQEKTGNRDGTGSDARFAVITATTLDPCKNIVVTDVGAAAIKRVTQSGIVTTIAGGGNVVTALEGQVAPSICQFSDADIPITVQTRLTLDALPNRSVTGCTFVADYTIFAHATANCSVSNITYTQSPAPGTRFTSNNPFDVFITATDEYGGTDTKSFKVVNTITGNTSPSVTVTAVSAAVCAGDPVVLHADVADAGNNTLVYQWRINSKNAGINSPDFSTTAVKTGDIITCVVTTTSGCGVPQVSPPVMVTVSGLPTVSLVSSQQILSGRSIRLTPTVSSNAVVYQWSPATGLDDANVREPIATPDASTTYTLTVLTDNGCSAQASTNVVVVKQITIPNTFTPNSDGVNDLWTIGHLQDYSGCTVSVFNRDGGVVFRSTGYAIPWNGTRNGKALPAGTYYYVIDLKDQQKPLSGWVTIIR